MQSMDFLMTVLQVLAGLFILALGTGLLAVIVIYIIDRTQKTHAIRRNFPVIGRFRYWFEHLGEFFRQYFFALDREEMPFNRAERSWVYRAAKNVDNTVAFGSTRDMKPVGSIIFVNCPYPTLDKDAAEPASMVIGPYCDKPYDAPSFFNLSAMSYGALSNPRQLPFHTVRRRETSG